MQRVAAALAALSSGMNGSAVELVARLFGVARGHRVEPLMKSPADGARIDAFVRDHPHVGAEHLPVDNFALIHLQQHFHEARPEWAEPRQISRRPKIIPVPVQVSASLEAGLADKPDRLSVCEVPEVNSHD